MITFLNKGVILKKEFFSLFMIFFFCITNTVVASDFTHLDPEGKIPKNLLAKTLDFYEKNKQIINNQSSIGIIDFSEHNSRERFFIVNMITGQVDSYLVAHGRNSDEDFDGYATEFSNTPDSLMSSQGFYLTAEAYFGKRGYSLRLDGLSESNSKARERDIVIHGASYVEQGRQIIGRSWGCPAVDLRYTEEIIDRIKDGMLLYAE